MRAAPVNSPYAVNLDLTGRPVLVVGAGPVAARKVAGLLRAGAAVTVVSPDAVPRSRMIPMFAGSDARISVARWRRTGS